MYFCEICIRENGWCLYDLETYEFFVARDVKFFESKCPFTSSLVNISAIPSGFGDPSFGLGIMRIWE